MMTQLPKCELCFKCVYALYNLSFIYLQIKYVPTLMLIELKSIYKKTSIPTYYDESNFILGKLIT